MIRFEACRQHRLHPYTGFNVEFESIEKALIGFCAIAYGVALADDAKNAAYRFKDANNRVYTAVCDLNGKTPRLCVIDAFCETVTHYNIVSFVPRAVAQMSEPFFADVWKNCEKYSEYCFQF